MNLATNNNKMPNKTTAGTDVNHVKQQNAQSAGAQQGQNFMTEFASETNVQEVKMQNQQSEQNKKMSSSK